MKDNWIDILPPVPPAETLPAWLWLSIGVFVILSPTLYLWYQSGQQKSLRTLKKLRAQLNNNDIQNIPFIIRNTIKQRFSVNNIEQVAMNDTNGWQDYKQRLITACFSKHELEPSEINNLLTEAVYWIKQDAAV